MSAPGATPGPWWVGQDNMVLAHDPIDPREPWSVADANLLCGYHPVQDAANANLIAASPALYDALELALQYCDYEHVRSTIRAALAQARGEAA